MQNLTGQTIDRYHILEQIGEGGMAVVYKAYDTRLEREVAIKIIRKEAFPPEELDRIFKRFEREAKSLAKLSHPNIIKVHDFGEYEGSPYLVMEYQPGGTLKDLLGKPMEWSECVRYIKPIAQALSSAHKQNIIHRDIKPSNILITKSSEPMLSDFGIAKTLESDDKHTLTGTGVGIGTPEYMAPEQGLGKHVDARADIYALGVVLYEMVTGRTPYKAETPMAVVIAHINDPLLRPKDFIRDIPKEIEQIIIKALAKDPENRFQSMDKLIASLDKNYRKYKIVSQTEIKQSMVLSDLEKTTNLPISLFGKADKVKHKNVSLLSLVIIGMFVLVGSISLVKYLGSNDMQFLSTNIQDIPSTNPIPSATKLHSTQTKSIPTSTRTPKKTITPSPILPTKVNNEFRLYDDFNKIDASLWEWDSSVPTQFSVKDGIITFTGNGNGYELLANRQKNWKLNQIGRLEALLRINETSGAYGFSKIGIQTQLNDGQGTWWAQCRLGSSDNVKPDLICDSYRWKDQGDMKYGTNAIPVDYGKFYKVAIEISSDGEKVEYFLDNKSIGSYNPPEADLLKNASFSWSIGVWTSESGKVEGSIDEVSVGEFKNSGNVTPTPSNRIYLSELKPVSAYAYEHVSFGEFPLNDGYIREGDPLQIRGKSYPNGIFAHAPSKIIYNLPAGFKEFHTLIGIFPMCGQDNGAKFIINLDGEQAFSSEPKFGQDPLEEVNLDISNVEKIELITNSLGDQDCDWTIWVDPFISN